jgi:hypothetical protein
MPKYRLQLDIDAIPAAGETRAYRLYEVSFFYICLVNYSSVAWHTARPWLPPTAPVPRTASGTRAMLSPAVASPWEREGWRVGRDTGVARWCHCRPRGAVKKFPFVFLNRHRKSHGSCYSEKKIHAPSTAKGMYNVDQPNDEAEQPQGLTLQGA